MFIENSVYLFKFKGSSYPTCADVQLMPDALSSLRFPLNRQSSVAFLKMNLSKYPKSINFHIESPWT